MAKNYQSGLADISSTTDSGSGVQSYEGEFTGSFFGDLTGNADTATSLAAPFSITLTGDASGTVSTSGKSAQLKIKVAQAAEAAHALTADTATTVQTAQVAATADFATNAASANTATKANVADNATHADFADEATLAARASYAEKSTNADHALTADEAKSALKATEAEVAQVANQLANPDHPVEVAKRSLESHIAEIARYDCLGRAFTNYYALKSDLEPYKDKLTINEGMALFVPREEQLLRATVRGRAVGSGVVKGNTLELMIESVSPCVNQNSEYYHSTYCDIEYKFLPNLPEIYGDTTKIYVDPIGQMHMWNQGERKWVTITSPLDEESARAFKGMKSRIEQLIKEFEVKLYNVVTLDGEQTIEGRKTFVGNLEAPIADINVDPARTVATIHNVRDARDQVRSELHIGYHHIMDIINRMQDEIDAQERGDILMGAKDYTIYANQAEMVYGTLYLNYLDKDKVYIPANTDTWTPLDPSKEIVYIRTLIKSKSDVVTWWDRRCVIDPNVWVPWHVDVMGKKHLLIEQGNSLFSEFNETGVPKNLVCLDNSNVVQAGDIVTGYNINVLDGAVTINGHKVICTVDQLDAYMPKSGGIFTGSIEVPSLHQSTKDDRVLNAYTTHKLIDEKISAFNNDLNIHKYMPKAGGNFTGKITVPQSLNLILASDIDVINKGDTQQLIDQSMLNSSFLELKFCDYTPECVDLMKPNVLYSMPVNDFWQDSDIHKLRVEPDHEAEIVPENNEGVIYGEKDKL